MGYNELIQTLCALSGLTCLVIGILTAKKQLKALL